MATELRAVIAEHILSQHRARNKDGTVNEWIGHNIETT